MKTQKVKQILLGLIVPVLILAAWICATHFGNIPTSILPKISMVWQAFPVHRRAILRWHSCTS